MNTLGLTAAITAFLSIWFGHVAVRKIESISPTIRLPTSIFVALGLVTEYCSLITGNLSLSTAFGITGITFLWDALEFTRQQNRVKHGHAPANPNNPRHARFLADPNLNATTQDLLKREPLET
jgi:hypothetical protein